MPGHRCTYQGPSRRIAFAGLLALACVVSPAFAQERGEGALDIGTVQEIYDGRLMPDRQVRTFRNIDRLFPTRIVAAGGPVRDFARSQRSLDGLVIPSGGKNYDLYDYMSMNRVAGLMVLKNGETVFEDYELGNDAQTRWMSMSIAKSITSTLVGAAIRDGKIERIDDRVDTYLPALRGTVYDGVTIRQILLMSSGVKWNERYTDPASDRRRMLDLQIGQKPHTILQFMGSLDRLGEPGTVWTYSTGETHILGELVAAATGKPLAEYLSEKIWSRAGMEQDATWWLEAPDGLEVGGSGLSATLRDYARFGQFILEDGTIGGERILPEGWVRQAGAPHEIGGRMVDYGYMWWPVSQNDGFEQDGAFAAIGIFGQYVYINPRRQVVIAMWGAQSKPEGSWPVDEYDFLEAVARHLD
ncbi:beta-lactamase family protein [Aureimonas altamirensis]|uniref:serine hydrolase domain-containing protein n=1 Tax=Aureimonas altamirensis TaxID=370622 RepID=UPI002036C9D2|nr:serine hydrolase [Aureimonas altamirensis]MCM2505485.1 beta-lactamase family protein [Aureimonas altamirensis]